MGEAAVERALLDMLVGEGPIGRLLDIGTGTGRILELLAPHSEHSIGLDVDHDMLQLARAALGESQLSSATVRHGDLRRLPFEAGSFDVAVMHHVLHLLDAPDEAIADAARLLRPGGRLVVADFASHDLRQLRTLHGHRRLGIADDEMLAWAQAAGLEIEADRALPPAGPDERLRCDCGCCARGPAANAGQDGRADGRFLRGLPPRTPEGELRSGVRSSGLHRSSRASSRSPVAPAAARPTRPSVSSRRSPVAPRSRLPGI